MEGLTSWYPRIDRSSWDVPALFRFLCSQGNIDRDESYQAFNMGVGMVLLIEPPDIRSVLADLRAAGETPFAIGRVEKGSGVVRWA